MERRFDPANPELMDRPQPVTPELERDLANLRSFNRWFGSHRLIRSFLRRWLKPNSSARILDVATGSGDIPRLIVDYTRRKKIAVRIEAIDQQEATIEIARRLSSRYQEINFIAADLFRWEPAAAYDIVISSLVLHHFSDQDAVRVLGKLHQLTRGAVLVADLRRTFWLSAAVQLLTALIYREQMTKIDARLSVERAFSFEEMRDLARRAGWSKFGHARFAVGRQALWIDPSS
jgi:ubiquinone/menaquinone biosynthesis C-methylase UbiE